MMITWRISESNPELSCCTCREKHTGEVVSRWHRAGQCHAHIQTQDNTKLLWSQISSKPSDSFYFFLSTKLLKQQLRLQNVRITTVTANCCSLCKLDSSVSCAASSLNRNRKLAGPAMCCVSGFSPEIFCVAVHFHPGGEGDVAVINVAIIGPGGSDGWTDRRSQWHWANSIPFHCLGRTLCLNC